jgi:hypothetical protein
MMFLVLTTGHTWHEIEENWDLPRVERWMDYCQKHPPLQWMVSAYLGFNNESNKAVRVTNENFDEFMKMIGGGSGHLVH